MAVERAELAQVTILEGVDDENVLEQLQRCPVRTLAKGEVLVTIGTPRDCMYMILGGRMSVHLEADAEPVAFVDAGQAVGELSVLDGRPASAHVVAAEPSRVLAVDRDTFWALVQSSHDFAINLLVQIAQRMRDNNKTVENTVRLSREYKRNAMVDPLTGLYNRRWLGEQLPRFVTRFGRGGQALAVLMIDIDHFKKLNDQHGHPAGDAVLSGVAGVLRANVRPTDHVSRYGGEEFTVVLPDTTRAAAVVIAERLRTAVRAAGLRDGGGKALPSVTISICGASLTADMTTADALIAKADAALYQSKHGGRDRVTFA